MRECPFNGCTKKIGTQVFACMKHWSLLDKMQKQRIWDAFNAYQERELTLDELRTIQGEVIEEVQG